MLVAVALSVPVFAQDVFGPRTVQPATYASPDGRWTLAVDPKQPDGAGAARYVLKHGPVVVWDGERPLTLLDVVVDDAGHAAGYAYEGRAESWESTLHVLLLAPDGKVTLDDRVERRGSRHPDGPNVPFVTGLFLHAMLGRVLVRVASTDATPVGEEWWAYDLALGKGLFKKRPRASTGSEDPVGDLVKARALNGTPLALAQWMRFDRPRRQTGARFALLDAELATVWELVLPDDYAVPGDDDAESRQLHEISRSGALLPNDAPGRFDLRFVKPKQRVTFEVRPTDVGATRKWRVEEVGRVPYEPAKPAPPPAIATLRLREIATATLAGGPAPRGDVRDVEAFGFDAEGRLRFVRREPERAHFTLLLVTTAGATEHASSVTLPLLPDAGRVRWCPLAAGRWLAAVSGCCEGVSAQAWVVSEADGTASALEPFDFQAFVSAAALSDGGFVALAKYQYKFTSKDVLRGFDTAGKTRWTVEGGALDGHLFSPQSVCVSTRGEVVVLENIRGRLQVFDRDGHWLRAIELEKAWARAPVYPSEIHADVDGGVLVRDFAGHPGLVRMHVEGPVESSTWSQFEAARQDGSSVDALARFAQVAPDGRVWTTDEQLFLRLDAQGVADSVLGQPAESDVLGEPGATEIDHQAHVLIQDARSGAVHVFDRDGKQLRVCKPDPKAVSDPSTIDRIDCAPDGSIRAPSGADGPRRLRFGPEGDWRGLEEEPEGDIAFVPGTDRAWTRTNTGLVLRDGQGKELARLERTPDGRFFEGVNDFRTGGDGTLFVLCGGSSVVLFDALGRPVKQIALAGRRDRWRVAGSRRFIAVSGYGAELALVAIESGEQRAVEIGGSGSDGSSWTFGFAPDGEELWGLEVDARRLHRFALPP